MFCHPVIVANSSPKSEHDIFTADPKITRCSHLGSILTEDSCFPFIALWACAGCDSCRATADWCYPSTALCVWWPSASPCLWPSACSLRCLRYSTAAVQLLLLPFGEQMAQRAAGEKRNQITYTSLNMHNLILSSYSSRLSTHVFKTSKCF